MDYLWHVAVMAALYVTLVVSLNLLIGYSGLFSVAHAAFFGIGGYASGILTLNLGWNPLLAAVVGALAAAVISALLALASVRVHGLYFVIASFGFQMIAYSSFLNLINITGGPMGFRGVPRPELFGAALVSRQGYFVLAALLALLSLLIAWRLTTSAFGRVLKTMREDEVVAVALGKDVVYFKVAVFAVASAMASLAGSVYAHYSTLVHPDTFTVLQSVLILSMVVLGGAASLRGSVIGAILMVLVPEVLRWLRVPDSVLGPSQQIVYGLLVILFMRLRPQGLLGEHWGMRQPESAVPEKVALEEAEA